MESGKVNASQGISIKEALKWPEIEKPFQQKKGISGKWVSETKEAYSAYKDLAPGISPIKITSYEPEIILDFPQANLEKPKPRIEKKNSSLKPESRSFSDTKFAQAFHKPLFAQYGQGNVSIGRQRLFGKKYMKTFNIVPLVENKDAVYFGAKAKSFMIKQKTIKQDIVIKNKDEVCEAPKANIEVLEMDGHNENIKIESSTQSGVIDGRLCKKCMDKYELNEENVERIEVILKNPKDFKGMNPQNTLKIPYAGKSKKRSETAYQVIFGQ